MKSYNKKYCFKIVVICIGLILAWIIASLQSGFAENVDSLGGTSYIYDISLDKFTLKTNCEISEKTVNILDDEAEMGLVLVNPDKYDYIILDINWLQTPKDANVKLSFLNDLNKEFNSKDIKLNGDKQIIEIPVEKFSQIKISFSKMENKSIIINEIVFRSSLENEIGKEFVYIFIIVFILFNCIVALFWRFLGEKLAQHIIYAPIKIILFIFCKIYNGILEKKSFNNNKIKYWLTSVIFLLLMYKMYSLPSYSEPYYLQIVALTCILVFMIIIIITDRKEDENVKWHNPLAYAWFALAILEIISEIIVGRQFYFVGCARLFIFGFLFYVWGKNTDRLKLLRSFSLAVKISFVVCYIWCLFVPYTKGVFYRYAGPFYSCNLFALYLVLPFSSLIADIDEEFEKKELCYKFVIKSMLLGGCITLVWLTQSRSALLAVFLIGIICFFKWIVTPAFLKNKKQIIIKLILISIIIMSMYHVSISLMNNFALTNSDSEVIAGIVQKAEIFTIHAEASNMSRILIKFTAAKNLNEFSSGRIGIWIDYLRNVGILGKNKYIFFDRIGYELAVHNGIIATMYITGIFAVIPYVIMLFYSFKYACIYLKRNAYKQRYGIFPLAVLIAYFCSAMLDIGEEDPFYNIIWLAYFLIVGFLMNMNNHPHEGQIKDDKLFELECKKWDHIFRFVKQKNIITSVVVVILVVTLGSLSRSNDIYNNITINDKVVETPFSIVSKESDGVMESVNFNMPQNMHGTALYQMENEGLTYLYFRNSRDELTVAVSMNDTNWFKYEKVILDRGFAGAFDDTLINKVNVVYVSPYYYMVYIGANAEGNTEVGLALSYDGINWTKKNIKSSISVLNVQDISTNYNTEEEVLKISYIDSNNETGIVNVSVAQNRDMTQFDTEYDWTTSLVSSENVLNGSYAIEGEVGTKNVWMKSESSIDLYYKEESSIININGYMPLEQYIQKNINEVNLVIKVNGENVYEKTFNESEAFDIKFPIDTIEKKGQDYMHIELITDADFNPKELGGSQDGRDLSYILYNIKQE